MELRISKLEKIDYNYLSFIEEKIRKKESISREELTYFLDVMVSIVRNKIYDEEHPNFEFKCDLAQSIICYYLNDMGVINYPCSTIKTIYSSAVGHNFIVAVFNIDGKEVNYLIDPTYIQFFKEENCNDKKYTDINGYIVETPDPGYFIDKKDMEMIGKFNYYGFGELNEELAKIYGNSFYNTRTMRRDKKIDSLSGDYYINSFIKNGNEKLSKTREELINDGYYIDFNRGRAK